MLARELDSHRTSSLRLLTARTMQLSRRAAFHAALLCASTTSVPPLFAADSIAPDTPAPLAADAPIDTGEDVVRDLAHYLPADEKERLIRILRKGEQQTGVRLRVLSRSRASPEWAFEPREVRSRLGIDAPSRPDSLLLIADRGLEGALEAGSAFLSFEVGDNLGAALPPVFFGRLRQEYGRQKFISARGEAASIVTACELILSCLRSEDGFCTSVPPPCLSKACVV